MDSHLGVDKGVRWQEVKLPGNFDKRLLAEHDGLLKWTEEAISPFRFQLSITPAGVQVSGDEVARTLVSTILERIGAAWPENGRPDTSLLKMTISSAVKNCLTHELAFRLDGLPHPVRCMSLSQFTFMQALLAQDKTFIIGAGPAGTGKTHLAIAAGLNELALGHVKHLVITRPHVVMEGEIVTPATRQENEADQQFNVFDDMLRDLIGHKETNRLVDQRMLEITPLGRMRGRTFNESFIIVDEAQNMTIQKMRMVVTRIGHDSRIVMTGDPTQVDLRGDDPSGLVHLLGLVRGMDFVTIHRFENHQIIRNKIVARLEELYSRQGDENSTLAA
jgi:phosphate starvation-inducible PhoH-like protein